MYALTSPSLDWLTLNAVYPVCHENARLDEPSLTHFDELALSFSMRSARERLAGRTKSKWTWSLGPLISTGLPLRLAMMPPMYAYRSDLISGRTSGWRSFVLNKACVRRFV